MAIYFNLETRTFGAKSKLLGAVSSGAWHNKEAEKYLHDNEEDYKKRRGTAALKGFLAPTSALYKHEEAAELHRQGKSAKEIREHFDKNKEKRILGAVAENVITPVRVAGNVAGRYVGLYEGLTDSNRKLHTKGE